MKKFVALSSILALMPIAIPTAAQVSESPASLVQFAEPTACSEALEIRPSEHSLGQLVATTNPTLALQSDRASQQVSLEKSLRGQILNDLVLQNDILFNSNTLEVFELSYKKLVYEGHEADEFNFTIHKAGQNFVAFKQNLRLEISETIWRDVVKNFGLERAPSDAIFVEISERMHISTLQAKGLFNRLVAYNRDPSMRSEVIDFINTSLPGFLKIAPVFTGAFEIQQMAFNHGSNNKFYKASLWRRIAIPAATVAAMAVPLAVGVPWEHFYHGVSYWNLSYYTMTYDRPDLHWYLTKEVAALVSPIATLPVLASLRKLIGKFYVRPRFRNYLKRLTASGQPLLENERKLLENSSDDEIESTLEESVADFSKTVKELADNRLSPKNQEYADAQYANFGEADVGERNLLASGQLFALQGLLARKLFMNDLGQSIRQKLATGRIDSQNQQALVKSIYAKISARKSFLNKIRGDIAAVEKFLNETNSAIDQFIAYAASPEAMAQRQKSMVIEKNMANQLLALQEQKAMTGVLNKALEQLEKQSATESSNLSRATNALTLVNVGQTLRGSDSSNPWLALAAILETI